MTVAIRARIYLEDTDAGGVVYHTGYLRFMERARTETLRSGGVDQSQLFEMDGSFVVHRMELRFASAAKLDDEVIATCTVVSMQGARCVFNQKVYAAATEVLHCEATVECAYISLANKRPQRIPQELSARLRPRPEPPSEPERE